MVRALRCRRTPSVAVRPCLIMWILTVTLPLATAGGMTQGSSQWLCLGYESHGTERFESHVRRPFPSVRGILTHQSEVR